MRARELTCVSYVLTPDRGPVAVEELTAAEKDAWRDSMRRRLRADLGAFYAQNPKE